MEAKEEDVKMVANKFSERQSVGTSAQSQDKGWKEPPPSPLFEPGELKSWSFWRAGIAKFSVGPFIRVGPFVGTVFNPAKSIGAAIIFNKGYAWDDHWIFWVGPFIGVALVVVYHQIVIRAIPLDILSGPFHWSSTCNSVPLDYVKGNPIQSQRLYSLSSSYHSLSE